MLPVSAEGHAARDEFVRKSEYPNITLIDVYDVKVLVKELESTAATGQARAVAVAKKAGLVPVGRPDLSYGIHGGKEGPIEMWFQVSAEGK